MLIYKDYTEDYRLEKKKLENLKKKQDRWKKMIPLGIVCLPIGVLFLRYVVVGAVLFFANLFYGPGLIIWGLHLIWRGYIHSDWPSAIKLADRYHIDTLEKQKEECSVRIGEWKRKIERTEKRMLEEKAKYSDYSDIGGPVIEVEMPDPEMDWLYAGGKKPEKWEADQKELSEMEEEDPRERKKRRLYQWFWEEKILLKCIGGVVALGILLLGIYYSVRTYCMWSGKMLNGTYTVRPASDVTYPYPPDACITVKGNRLQFHNIDLNAVFGEAVWEDYYRRLEEGEIQPLDEARLSELSDLNARFVDRQWSIDYSTAIAEDPQSGNFIIYLQPEEKVFGLILHYVGGGRFIDIRCQDPEKRVIFVR